MQIVSAWWDDNGWTSEGDKLKTHERLRRPQTAPWLKIGHATASERVATITTTSYINTPPEPAAGPPRPKSRVGTAPANSTRPRKQFVLSTLPSQYLAIQLRDKKNLHCLQDQAAETRHHNHLRTFYSTQRFTKGVNKNLYMPTKSGRGTKERRIMCIIHLCCCVNACRAVNWIEQQIDMHNCVSQPAGCVCVLIVYIVARVNSMVAGAVLSGA